MFFKKKTAVYLSSDEADFKLAKEILKKEQILYYEYAAEEMPVAGCGARINPARLNNPVERMVFRLSVVSEDVEKAVNVLQGKVKYVINAKPI
jgi:hypothetical protein